MSSAWILANGPLRVGRTPPPAPDLVIAADGGARHAAALGVTVDYWIGDFDSARSGQLPQPVDPERRVLPTDKDLLDSEAALGLAASLGARRIVIWGGLGGRSDHALALLLVALRWRPRFSELVLRSGREWALPLLPGHLELELAAGQVFSIVPMQDMEAVRLRGARWELDGEVLPWGSGRPHGNQAEGGVLILDFRAGSGILIGQELGTSGKRVRVP